MLQVSLRTVFSQLTCASALLVIGGIEVSAQTPRVGVISATAPDSSKEVESFAKAMRELGYVDGQSVTLVIRYAEGKQERYAIIAKELVELPVDVIVTLDNTLTRTAANTTKTIPIVGAGMAASVDRSGGNVTGVSIGGVMEAAKMRLLLLSQIVHPMSRLSVLFYSTNPPELPHELLAAAKERNIVLLPISVSKAEDLDRAFDEAKKMDAQAMMTMTHVFFSVERRTIAQLARRHRLPLAGSVPAMAEAGVPVQVSPDRSYCAARAATYVERILKGEKAGELPVEHCDRVEVVFNLDAARAVGLTIDSALTRGARVIE